MRHPFLLGACLLLGAFVPGAMAACGLDVSGLGGSGPDASEASALDTGVIDTGAGDTGLLDTGGHDSGLMDGEAGPAESSMPEASCTGLTCNGACISASDCRSCNGAPLLCASTGQCVAACQGCKDTSGTAMPIECFACDSTHANPIGSCQYDDAGTYCLSGDYLGQYQGNPGFRCACDDVSQCPGATQVCVPLGASEAGFCLTCGESTIGPIQGQPCQ